MAKQPESVLRRGEDASTERPLFAEVQHGIQPDTSNLLHVLRWELPAVFGYVQLGCYGSNAVQQGLQIQTGEGIG